MYNHFIIVINELANFIAEILRESDSSLFEGPFVTPHALYFKINALLYYLQKYSLLPKALCRRQHQTTRYSILCALPFFPHYTDLASLSTQATLSFSFELWPFSSSLQASMGRLVWGLSTTACCPQLFLPFLALFINGAVWELLRIKSSVKYKSNMAKQLTTLQGN